MEAVARHKLTFLSKLLACKLLGYVLALQPCKFAVGLAVPVVLFLLLPTLARALAPAVGCENYLLGAQRHRK